MAIVGGMSPGGRVLAEMCHFIFCCNSSHFAAFHPQNKKNIFKIQNSRRGEKEAGEKRTELSDKAETHQQRGGRANTLWQTKK